MHTHHMQKHMPLLRNTIAAELENHQIQDHILEGSENYPLLNFDHQLGENMPENSNCKQDKINSVMNCHSDDSDFIVPVKRRKRGKVRKEACDEINSGCSDGFEQVIVKGMKFQVNEEINPDNCHALQELLPLDDMYTYVITDFSPLPTEKFLGAPEFSYEATIRVNTTDEASARCWMAKMMTHSQCTYRHTRGRKPGLKRVLYKAEMHCQHQKKKLTLKQQQNSAEAKSKNSRKVLMHDNRQKKTSCPSKMSVIVKVPTKKDCRSESYFVSHPTVVQVTFNHNHPLASAHALSFRPIAPETKEIFYELFRKGHTASSAYHWHETKLFLDGGEDQALLADRAFNPTKPDISRLYNEWQKKELGSDNGKPMFDSLQCEIEAFNETCGKLGGKAKLQCFQAGPQISDSDSDDPESFFDGHSVKKKHKRHTANREKPMIIAICTPLMSRVHKHIQQAGEMVFCDSTSTLDRFNTSLFILSTSHPSGGMPLGVLITSDEQEETLTQGFSLLKQVLPEEAFYNCGANKGPTLAMTDDSLAERNAFHSAWPAVRLLLCTFHFLQAKWTWLHDGAHQIQNGDRISLIKQTKVLVYADTESQLFHFYDQFQINDVVKKYPHYLQYIKCQWDRRKEWALCYRKHLLVRGNQTNNYAEAGIRILKDLVFSRVKAYNLLQMFSFVTECLELYYVRKILSVAHNRMDRHISLKFQGVKCSGISLNQIQDLDKTNLTYLVVKLNVE